MNKIEFFNLRNLHNDEHFQFLTDVDVLIAKLLPAELGLTSVYPAFKEAFAVEGKALKIEQGSIKSEAIEAANKLRGRTWNAILRKIKAFLISPFDDEVQSAERLMRIVNLHGDPRTVNYNEASTTITNVVSDLQLPANAADMEKLTLTAWVGELKKQNNAFQTLFNERNAELAGRDSGNVQPTRQVVDPLYQKMVDKVNAAIELELAKPVAETFVNEVNQRIKYYQMVLSLRESRNSHNNHKKDNGDKTAPDK